MSSFFLNIHLFWFGYLQKLMKTMCPHMLMVFWITIKLDKIYCNLALLFFCRFLVPQGITGFLLKSSPWLNLFLRPSKTSGFSHVSLHECLKNPIGYVCVCAPICIMYTYKHTRIYGSQKFSPWRQKLKYKKLLESKILPKHFTK